MERFFCGNRRQRQNTQHFTASSAGDHPAICELFDAYAAANGYANLQIYSTLDGTLDSTSIYTNILPDRSTGYGFDIGLITSTGEVVPYITKCKRVDGGKTPGSTACAALLQATDRLPPELPIAPTPVPV